MEEVIEATEVTVITEVGVAEAEEDTEVNQKYFCRCQNP